MSSTTSTSCMSCISDTVWINWSSVTTAGTITQSGDHTIFSGWCFDYSISSATGSNDAWVSWSDGTYNFEQSNISSVRQQQIESRQEERQSQYDEVLRMREVAEDKAKQLLLDLIGDTELKVYEETGRLFVKGKKHDYIVQKEGFVKQIQKDKLIDLCVALDNQYRFPKTDNVIALKLAIENSEDEVLKVANNQGEQPREELPKAACM